MAVIVVCYFRYRNIPDSSGAHHSPRVGPVEGYLPMPSQTGDHLRRSPAINPDYPRQHYERDRERERQDKEMKDREQQMAVRAASKLYLLIIMISFLTSVSKKKSSYSDH